MANALKIGDIVADKYEIEEILGSGGIGTVYRAYQQENSRTVALKILHESAALDQEYRDRFLQEARALSKLHHINVVTVYHLGESAQGMYLAMEYLEGKSVRALLNSTDRLPAARALKMIRDAARALMFVHQQEIIHRDLKPENIMVVDEPAPDTVKLVDFGLARIIDETKNQKLTKTGTLIGTSSYMSPEQCMGKSVDFRSDIYSLSACLYEMLTGEKPFDADSAVGLMYKHINEAPPTIHNKDLNQRFPSLNNVISRGMAKAPGQRFDSMDELADEIDAMLNALSPDDDLVPIKSVGQAASGRRWIVFTAILLLCFSITMLSRNLLQASHRKIPAKQVDSLTTEIQQKRNEIELRHSIERKERRFGKHSDRLVEDLYSLGKLLIDEGQTDEGLRTLLRAQLIDEKVHADSPSLIMHILDVASAFRRHGSASRAESLSDHALVLAEKSGLEGEPLRRTLFSVATAKVSMNKQSEAILLMQRALSLARAEPNPRASEIASYLQLSGECYSIKRDFSNAESMFKACIATRVADAEAAKLLDEVYSALAFCYEREDKFEEAERLFRRVLQRTETHQSSFPLVQVLQNLATCCQIEGKQAEAEFLFRRVLLETEKTGGSAQAASLAFNNLASCLMADGQPFSAVEALLKRALDRLGKEDNKGIIDCLSWQAEFYRQLQMFPKEEEMLKRELVLDKKIESAKVASDMSRIAFCYSQQGKYSEAEELCKEAIALNEKNRVADADIGMPLYGLATFYANQNNFSEAEIVLRRALAAAKKTPPLSPYTCQSLFLLLRCLEEQDRIPEAESIIESYIAADPHAPVSLWCNLAQQADGLGQDEKAENSLRHACAIAEEQAANSFELSEAQSALGVFFQRHNKFREAEPFFRRALSIQSKLHVASSDLLGCMRNLCQCYHEQRKFKDDDVICKQAVQICNSLPEGSQTLASCLVALSEIQSHRGKPEEAELLLKRAIAIRKRGICKDHAVIDYETLLSQLYESEGLYSAAEPLLQDALAIRQSLDNNGLRCAESLHNLVDCNLKQGKYDVAQRLMQRIYSIREKLDPTDPCADCLLEMATTFEQQNQQLDAERAFAQAVSQCKARRPNDRKIIECLLQFTEFCYRRKKYDEGDTLLKEAHSWLDRLKMRPSARAQYMVSMANCDRLAGKSMKAELELIDAIAQKEKLGMDSLADYTRLALCQLTMWHREDAIKSLKRALSRQALSAEQRADCTFWLGHIELLAAKLPEAEKDLQHRLALQEPLMQGLPDTLMVLGFCYQKEKNYSNAESSYRRGLAIREKFLPFDSEIIGGYAYLADCLMEEGKVSQAQQVLEHALAMEKTYPLSSYLDYACFLLAECYQKNNRTDQANYLIKRGLSISPGRVPPISNMRDCLLRLAALHEKNGKLQDAELLLRRALLYAQNANPDTTIRPEAILKRINALQKRI